jgi:hypothetical protein
MPKPENAEQVTSPTDEVLAAASDERTLADNEVELDEPLVRGKQTIDVVAVRKPQSGELRGVSLQDLLNLDVSALLVVLPRITTPTLTQQEVARLEPADLVQLGSKVSGFLLTKRVKKEFSLTA